MSFKFDASSLIKGLSEREIKTRASLGLYADTVAKKMESYAKTNKPWVDRTGRATQSLNSSWKWKGDVARVELSHGVDYGVYLELAHEKRFAILQPTVNALSKEILEGFKELMRYI